MLEQEKQSIMVDNVGYYTRDLQLQMHSAYKAVHHQKQLVHQMEQLQKV